MFTKSNADPVGDAQEIPEFELTVSILEETWNEKNKENSSSWKFNKVNLSLATGFLLGALDELVVTVDQLLLSGPDKKATVLSGLDRLYEYVMKEAFPIWLKPFGYAIKQYVIYSLASYFIDYIVYKYKNGIWREKIKQGG